MTDIEIAHFWLGNNPVQDTNRITAPKQVFDPFDVLTTEPPRQAHWGSYPAEHRVVVSRKNNWFGRDVEPNALDYQGTTKVQETSRVVTIPKRFFPEEFEGSAKSEKPAPEALEFEHGETRYFVLKNTWWPWRLCYVLDMVDEQMLREQYLGQGALPDGGWDEPTGEHEDDKEQEEMDEIIPEAEVGPGEVLHLESGEVRDANEVVEELEAQEEALREAALTEWEAAESSEE